MFKSKTLADISHTSHYIFIRQWLASTLGLVTLTSANIVDGIVVGRFVGVHGLAVISLLLPYFTLLVALSLAIAIGGAVKISHYLGAGNSRRASEVFSVCLGFACILNLLLAFASYCCADELITLLNIPTSLIAPANEYLSVIRWALLVQLVTMVLYYFLRCDHFVYRATLALVFGALLNIAFDIFFVGHLTLGLNGAAYATLLAQIIQLAVLLTYFFQKKTQLSLIFCVKWPRTLWPCLRNGFSEFINETSVGVMLLVLNFLLLATGGEVSVAAFSIVNYVIFASVMLSFGLADALHPLVSYQLGNGNIKQANQYVFIAFGWSFALGILMALSIMFYGPFVMQWFASDANSEVLTQTTSIINVIWPLFLVNGATIIAACYFTACQKPFTSSLLALIRSAFFPIALLFALFYYYQITHGRTPRLPELLIALPIAEWGAALIAACFIVKKLRID